MKCKFPDFFCVAYYLGYSPADKLFLQMWVYNLDFYASILVQACKKEVQIKSFGVFLFGWLKKIQKFSMQLCHEWMNEWMINYDAIIHRRKQQAGKSVWEIGLLTDFSCLVMVITTFQKSFHVRFVKSETLAYFLIGSGYRYEERDGRQSSYARLSATFSGSSSRYDGPPWNIYTKIININRSNWTGYQEYKTNRRQINTRSLFCLYTI